MLNKNEALEVINKKSPSGSSYNTWIFKCKGCDNKIKAQASQIKTHSGKCRRCTQLGKPYAFIYNELLKSTRSDKYAVTLTYKELVYIIKNDSNCHYCDTKLTFHKHSKVYGANNSRAYQLDRKNNMIGYTKDNVVPCCWTCNRLKSDAFTYDEFMKLSPILKEIQTNRKK